MRIFWRSKACSACSTSLSLQQLCTPRDSTLVRQGLLSHTCLACHQSSVAALSQSGSFAAISVSLERCSVFRRSAEWSVFLWDGNVNTQIFCPRSEPSYCSQPRWTAGRCSPKHARALEHLLANALAHCPFFQGRVTWKDTLRRHHVTVSQYVTACRSYLAKRPVLKFMIFLSKKWQSRNKSNRSCFWSRWVKTWQSCTAKHSPSVWAASSALAAKVTTNSTWKFEQRARWILEVTRCHKVTALMPSKYIHLADACIIMGGSSFVRSPGVQEKWAKSLCWSHLYSSTMPYHYTLVGANYTETMIACD